MWNLVERFFDWLTEGDLQKWPCGVHYGSEKYGSVWPWGDPCAKCGRSSKPYDEQ